MLWLLFFFVLAGCDQENIVEHEDPTGSEVETISTGSYPNGVVANETHFFVVLGGEHAGPDSQPAAKGVEASVEVFSLDGTYVTEILVDGGGHTARATEDGSAVLVAHFNAANVVSVIDTETMGVKQIVGGEPEGPISLPDALALSADGKHAFVGSNSTDQSGWVAQISLADYVADENWRAEVEGGTVSWLEADFQGDYIYVSSWSGGTVQRKSAVTGEDAGSIVVGANPHAIILDSDAKFGYVAISGGNDLVKIDLADFTLVGSLPGPWEGAWGGPSSVVLSKDGNYLFVANQEMGAVAVVDINPEQPTFETVVELITVGSQPVYQALSFEGNTLFVSNNGNGTVSRIDVSLYR